MQDNNQRLGVLATILGALGSGIGIPAGASFSSISPFARPASSEGYRIDEHGTWHRLAFKSSKRDRSKAKRTAKRARIAAEALKQVSAVELRGLLHPAR